MSGAKVKSKGKVYGYVRVSTEKQDEERQVLDITAYAAELRLGGVEFVRERVSSRKVNRKVFELVEELKENDVVLVTELSRLARSMIELNGIIAEILKRKAVLMVQSGAMKEIRIDGSIQSNAIVFALGIAAQVERDMISERTKSGLRKARAEGRVGGRPAGKGKKVEEAMQEKGITVSDIEKMVKAGASSVVIGRMLEVDPRTMRDWLRSRAGK